jgi:F-type H+-transporting ATPase subunit b
MNRRLTTAFAIALTSSQAYAAKIPQLDPTWFASQLFWLVLCFGTLLVVVKAQIHPKVHRVLQTRDEAIQGALKEAEFLKESAEATKSNFEQSGSDARSTASALVLQTVASVNARIAEEQAKHDALLATKIADAEASVKRATVKAMAEVTQPTANLVQAMAGRLLGKDVTNGDAESAVKKVA